MRQRNIHNYYVYMMTNEWRNVLYTGVTNSLERRVWDHKNGAIKGFTKKYNCFLLVFHEVYQQVTDAIEREKQIKGWSHAKKNALVEELNPKWHDLAADWYREPNENVTGDPSPRSAAPRLRRLGMTDARDAQKG